MNALHRFVVLSIAAASLGTSAFGAGDWQFSEAERVVAVADIHGAYAAFERILQRAEIIDEDGDWAGGTAHLVIIGDVLDRGAESRRALDLIMRLESEATAAGGRVHLVLGNHEVMNLTGDLRYVSAGEYRAFAADEPPELREAAFERYLDSLDGTDEAERIRQGFEEQYPPGYFAHRRAFASDGVYGAWLLDKPLLLVIGNVAYVHGGLAGSVIEYGENLNEQLSGELADYVAAVDELTDAGVLLPTDDFYAHGARAELLLELQSGALFSPAGPTWYRGNVSCNRLTEQGRLEAALAGIGAEHLVVGHSPTPGSLVLSRMDQRLLRVDTGMLNDYYGGRAAALVIENGDFSVLYENETDASRPIVQPRRVGIRPGNLDENALEEFLRNAEAETIGPYDATASLVRLSDGAIELEALFTAAENSDVRPAVAAYRLDRLLGLDMVPVTVAREIDGDEGALEFLPLQSFSERDRIAENRAGTSWCPLADQLNDMYVFDMLIFNQARTQDRLRYSNDNLQLLLVGNDQTFSTDRGRPAYLESVSVEISPEWREALQALDEDSLTASLGDVLGRRGIRAILARRDRLLE